jgi:hypothetical protein
MLHRALPLLAILALICLVSTPALAADENTHEGLVVNVGDGKLIMTDKDGKKEHTHSLAKDAKITLDGKVAKLEDLKKGFKVKVTTEGKGATALATKIDADTK